MSFGEEGGTGGDLINGENNTSIILAESMDAGPSYMIMHHHSGGDQAEPLKPGQGIMQDHHQHIDLGLDEESESSYD